jgi:hypothetical protein
VKVNVKNQNDAFIECHNRSTAKGIYNVVAAYIEMAAETEGL